MITEKESMYTCIQLNEVNRNSMFHISQNIFKEQKGEKAQKSK